MRRIARYYRTNIFLLRAGQGHFQTSATQARPKLSNPQGHPAWNFLLGNMNGTIFFHQARWRSGESYPTKAEEEFLPILRGPIRNHG